MFKRPDGLPPFSQHNTFGVSLSHLPLNHQNGLRHLPGQHVLETRNIDLYRTLLELSRDPEIYHQQRNVKKQNHFQGHKQRPVFT
ncbi:hypothetical protein [Sedimenticola selenatireducens]|uniref:hypothetical protein n=1 Tax=Sedimenticola selenatireducens TaxID=191960 RepID=UPI0012FB65C6|nr:hypothetical protein [Sedimenticola selenatireducens]